MGPGWGHCSLQDAVDNPGIADAAGVPDDYAAARRARLHDIAVCVQARWGAVLGHRRSACWAFADRESIGCGRFATSSAYPSNFALRLIVFYLGLHYSD